MLRAFWCQGRRNVRKSRGAKSNKLSFYIWCSRCLLSRASISDHFLTIFNNEIVSFDHKNLPFRSKQIIGDKNIRSKIKFIYEKATRFRKIFWPSQSICTLKKGRYRIFCQNVEGQLPIYPLFRRPCVLNCWLRQQCVT